ncbi:hypothetical protein OTU49_003196 [Cherax quadricarinatus]|uniref:Uncharacterized protein n=1 Tax=Cherax quadricarinatus TaxID=27406 RepID=A0AAW0XIG6_CHEQU
MECVNYKIDDVIPLEYAKITLASSSFYKHVNILNQQLQGEESVKKHTIIATTLGHLIELQGEKVLRSMKLTSKTVAKIVVHHNFHPVQLYIVLLYSTHKAVILSYHDFKTLHEWENIADISSEDPQAIGVPHLRLLQLNGEVTTISSTELITLYATEDKLQEEGQKGKSDAVESLARRLKNLMAVLTIESSDDIEKREMKIAAPKPPLSCVTILNVRHKVVHDKWVIGLNIINNADRLLVCSPQLILQVTTGASILSYTSLVLKIVQRRQAKADEAADGSLLESKVTIEKLEPPVLRPKKRACVLGVCEIPIFNEGSTVNCSGILSYSCKSLKTETTQLLVPEGESPLQQYQMTFEPIQISAQELHSHSITIEVNVVQAGVPFSTVALIAGSICNSVSFTSLVSPLTEFIPRVSKAYKLVKGRKASIIGGTFSLGSTS